jgi:hypothetical protein
MERSVDKVGENLCEYFGREAPYWREESFMGFYGLHERFATQFKGRAGSIDQCNLGF